MKRILKKGKIVKNIQRFKCPNCGCVFEADEDDYIVIMNFRNDFCSFLESKCPACYWNVYIDKD